MVSVSLCIKGNFLLLSQIAWVEMHRWVAATTKVSHWRPAGYIRSAIPPFVARIMLTINLLEKNFNAKFG